MTRKKIGMLLLALAFIVSMTLPTLAKNDIQPYAELCSVCGGRMTYIQEEDSELSYFPCGFGYGGTTDFYREFFDYTYYECEDCGRRIMESKEHKDSYIHCLETGNFYYEGVDYRG